MVLAVLSFHDSCLVLLVSPPPPLLLLPPAWCRKQMRQQTAEHPLMLAEPSHNTKEAREKLVALLFEKYNAPGGPVTIGLPWLGHEA